MTAAAPFALLLVAALAAGCGDAERNDAGFAKRVAADFRKDCESAGAPNEAMRKHLLRLCSCTVARIERTGLRVSEGDDAINEKVNAAADACHEEVGGLPGEGRADRTAK